MKTDKKKIAKNAILLFFRMGIMTLVALFTSRIVLQQLGASDYGTYNVVGGIVTMMGFLTGSLSHGIQRFINYYSGKGDLEKINEVYSAGVVMMLILAAMVLIVGETLGLWFLNEHLNISASRMSAANWVYQFSLISVVASLFQIPHIALIIANENMGVYAYVSIFEVIAKCFVAYALSIVTCDKLVIYGFLLMVVCFSLSGVYWYYCCKKYVASRFSFCRKKEVYVSLATFSGWNVLGTSTNMFTVTGINIVLNLFFGTIVNAARAISVQVSNCVDNLIQNVQTAMNPQLVKLYSTGETESMKVLLMDNFRWNFFLSWIVTLPLMVEIDYVLYLWLGNVPQYTSVFVRIILLRCLIKCFERPLITAVFAVGEVKGINIASSSMMLCEIVLVLILFSLGYPPYWCFLLDLLAVAGCVVYDMFFLRKRNLFSFLAFARNILVPLVTIILISTGGTLLALLFQVGQLGSFFLVCVFSVIFSSVSIFFIGLSNHERKLVISKLEKII